MRALSLMTASICSDTVGNETALDVLPVAPAGIGGRDALEKVCRKREVEEKKSGGRLCERWSSCSSSSSSSSWSCRCELEEAATAAARARWRACDLAAA